MRRTSLRTLRGLACALALAPGLPVGAQDPATTFSTAKALGQALAQSGAQAVKSGEAENTTVRRVVPGYTARPVEAQSWANANPGSVAAQRRAQCALTPSDPVCAATTVGTTARPITALVPPSHPALAGQAAAADPTRALGQIASTYNACSVGGTMSAPAGFSGRSCVLEADPWTREVCHKTLTASPVESATCTLGSVLDGAQWVRGGPDVMEVQALCALGQTPNVRLRASARGGRGACAAPLDLPLDLSQPLPRPGGSPEVLGHLAPHWGGSCQRLAVVWEGPGCQNGACRLNVHFVMGDGVQTLRRCNQPGEMLGSRVTFRGNETPQSDQQCYSAFGGPDEAVGRVGGWAQVGDGETFWWAHTSDSVPDGWAWTSSERWTVALAFVEPRLKPAAGDIWTNSCSALEQRTPGLAPDGVTPPVTVPMLVNAPAGTPQCVRTGSECTEGPSTKLIDGVPVTRECWAFRNTFDCSQVATGSGCTDPALRACTPVDAGCLALDALGRCVQARQDFACPASAAQFTPTLNCGAATFCADGSCWDNPQPPNGGFAQAVSQLQAHLDAAADFDPQAMQIFKGRDSRCTRDNLGLDNCCEDNAALLQRCSAEMQEVVRQREQGRCMQVGEYCSARTVFNVCRETTKTYCCFSSLLAKLVQVQGRAQVGRSWGSAKEPNCTGFRPEEIAALDWSAFDLSAFYAQIQVTPPPAADTLSGNAQAAQPRCYFGAGRC